MAAKRGKREQRQPDHSYLQPHAILSRDVLETLREWEDVDSDYLINELRAASNDAPSSGNATS